ncbi:MAG TPA: beta-propeller fold lactonase family protein, partial [Bryobacteraceae bacterium]
MVSNYSKCRIFGLVAFLALAGISKDLMAQVLYVGNVGDDTISAFVIDESSGLLTELLPRVASTGSPTSITVHPSGLYAYATNSGNAALGALGPSLTQFSIDPGTGALTQVSFVPLQPGSSPQAVVVDPSGNFAFVAHQGANYVTAFSIDPATGALTPVAGSPFAMPQGPTSIVMHPNGKFAYVSAAGAGVIAAYSYDSTGALTPLSGSPFAARNNIVWMTMDPAGKFLYAVERQDNAVLVYSVDPDSGALTQVGSRVAAGPGVTGVAVNPAGNYLYVSTAGNGGVTVFSIDPTGALTNTGSVGAINGANAAILDPSGQYLYVPGPQANAVAALAIDPSSGVVAPLSYQQFFPTGTQPQRGVAFMLSPPVLPPISATSAVNYHSNSPVGMPNSGIAQGSRLAISGTNIGPAAGASGSAPLQTQLGGVSIQIQSGDVTTSALMVYATNNFVTCVVPSSTPLGPATVTVNYNGRSTAPLPITIVATSVGLRSLNEHGVGPAKAWTVSPDTVLAPDPSILQNPITLNQSVIPGQLVILQGTGLGATSIDETQDLNEVLSVPANVVVGNEVVNVLYELRVADGSDYIVFQLPADVLLGCYVPVAVQAGGVTSNVVGISISASGGSCSDPTGLSSSDIDTAAQAGKINMNTILLSHIDFGPLGPSDSATGLFLSYDFNSLLAA